MRISRTVVALPVADGKDELVLAALASNLMSLLAPVEHYTGACIGIEVEEARRSGREEQRPLTLNGLCWR